VSVRQAYKDTPVESGRSKQHIEELLLKVGAKGFRWSSLIDHSEVLEAGLDYEGRERAFRLTVAYGNERERRQKLRALYWYLKSKLEAIEFGLVDLEQEFLPYLLTRSGRTLYEEIGGAETKLLEAPAV
jgi:hypothetical protein